MITEMKARTYTLRARALRQEATRRRIVEATVALHEEVGPKDTTISAIAEKAGVQRLTVYRHFPDEEALFEACSSHYLRGNPPPPPEEWGGEPEQPERTCVALRALYRYYRRTARMWTSVYRDLKDVPALQPKMDEFQAYLDAVRDDLLTAWSPPRERRRLLRAALGHAVRFSTWQSLKEEGLSDASMVELMAAWVADAAGEAASGAPAPPSS
jgi:AcrR family transcriptional regulator